MKRIPADPLRPGHDSDPPDTPRSPSGDEFVRIPSPVADPPAVSATSDSSVTQGYVLWTLTKGPSTAEARRWVTATGLELELQIWTGARVRGEEDLSWVQLFSSEETLAGTADAKKRQLEAAGWVEDIPLTPL
jgi:hypothetical protein